MRAMVVVFTFVGLVLVSRAARADGLTGAWSGSIEVPNQRLDISVTFAGDGAAVMDIPAQANGLALNNVKLAGKAVSFELTIAGATFQGTLEGDTIQGTMTQGGATVPFTLKRAAAAAGGDHYQPPGAPPRPLGERAGQHLVGRWEGELVHPTNGKLAFAAEFTLAHGAVVGAAGESRPCGGMRDVANLALTFDRIQLEVPGPLPTYLDATLSGDTIAGTAHRGGIAAPIALKRIAAADRPYRETEVAIASTKGTTLAATLTTPAGPPAPVVVLVTGSGPQDRDECVVGIRPFRQLADHLARHGIATLRYDDRGTARSTGEFASATGADFADDAEAAVAFLAARGDVDVRHIGILGHSEGGLIAPMVAARNPAVAFIVLWGGPGVPLSDVLTEQAGDIASAEGRPAAEVARAVAFQKLLWKQMHITTDRAKLKASLAAALKPTLTKAERDEIGDVDKWLDDTLETVTTPWFLWYLNYDPRQTLRKVACPVLAVNGALDRQVNARTNLAAVGKALAGHNKDVQLVELPGLNHVFQATKTGAISEYARNPPVMDPAVLDTTTRWIRTHTKLD